MQVSTFLPPLAALVLGVALGAAVTALLVRTRHAMRVAALATERDLLRERVEDLQASLAEDLETAALVAPLQDALGRVERQVGVLERDRLHQFGSIGEVLARVEAGTQELGRTTSSLAGSLRSSSVRGAWGEVQLRRVLECAGMLSRCDFDEQVTAVSRHDASIRPDVVVHLPGGKVIPIDAKAPMTAFLDAQADHLATGERERLLLRHAGALRQHVTALAAKEYWSAFATCPEMVLCFVPSDAMLATALAARPGLHEEALAHKVALVGPAALLATVRTVAFTWQQDALSDNARELLTLGNELYRRIGTLGNHAAKMGRALTAAVESYNALVGTLEGRVLVTARRMQELHLVTDDLPAPPAVGSGPRPLTAVELLDVVAEPETRPELVDLHGTAQAPLSASRAAGD